MHARGESLDRIGLTLRKDGHAGDVVAAALTQVQLREKAAAKFGDAAKNMLFTQAGLEQASRDVVAREHAARFVRAGATSVSDLGCGLGAESLAFLNAGMNVRAVEIDPFTAKLAAHNLSAAGARASHEVITGDAELLGPGGSDAAFFDPRPAHRRAPRHATNRLAR